ncbi:putative oxidoreductase [Podospora conica]|nr:putative oxidoreductase [Schizothecium conicum]
MAAPQTWHKGEQAAHALLRSPSSSGRNPTYPGLPPSYAHRLASCPLLAVGALDAAGRPWASLWTGSPAGERGFVGPVGDGVLGVQAFVDEDGGDPVVEAIFEGVEAGEGGVVRPEGGKVVAGLGIDLETRDRVKVAGRVVVAKKGGGGEVQVAVGVEESLGNCPKYLNGRVVVPRTGGQGAAEVTWRFGEGGPMGAEVLGVLGGADMFFLATVEGEGGSMDVNHRGGPRGFVRVERNEGGAGGVVVVYPEYSGNRLYQSLGNLLGDGEGRIGVVVPDFETGDVLYLTGKAEVVAGEEAGRVMPHAKVVVRIVVEDGRFVRDGLPFRGEGEVPSPYNPPVRRLAVEGAVPAGEDKGKATATLVKREVITDEIARFTFRLAPERDGVIKRWRAGQYITLDFSEDLDHGYSHMRDDDPQSLNDDFVRTFTISSPPPAGEGLVKSGTEVQLTLRRHGPATNMLWRQNIQAQLEVPILGFGGEENFGMMTAGDKRAVFVAGGVGITPLLAQAAGVLAAGREVSVLWTLRAEDLALAVDAFGRIPGLAQVTILFVTKAKEGAGLVFKVEEMGAKVELGRISQQRVLDVKGGKYFLCTSPELVKILLGWLEGEEVVAESFNY